MVKVLVRHVNAGNAIPFWSADLAELRQLVDREFGNGGRLKTDDGGVIGTTFLLEENANLIWFPPLSDQGPNFRWRILTTLSWAARSVWLAVIEGSCDPGLPRLLEDMLKSLVNARLQTRTLKWKDKDHNFQVLPLGNSLQVHDRHITALYMPPQYWQALDLLLGLQTIAAELPDVKPIPSTVLRLTTATSESAAADAGMVAAADQGLGPAHIVTDMSTDAAQGLTTTATGAGLHTGAEQGLGPAPHMTTDVSVLAGAPLTSAAHMQASTGQDEPEPSSCKKRPPEALEEDAPAKRSSGASSGAAYSTAGPSNVDVKNLLVGISGVGKTLFLYVLAWVLLRLGKTVLLHLRSFSTVIYEIKLDKPWKAIPIAGAHAKLRFRDTWYLCDSVEPVTDFVEAHSVLSASPKAMSVTNVFNKTARKLWFPSWTLLDVLGANTVACEPLEENQVEEGFKIFGGAPRAVVMYARQPDLKEQLDATIDSMSVNQLVTALTSTIPMDSISNSVLHVKTKDAPRPLSRRTMVFGSPYIAQRAVEALSRKGYSETLRFITACQDRGAGFLAAACGHALELCTDRVLKTGGDFQLNHLRTGKRLQLHLPPLPVNTFKKLEELVAVGAPRPALWVPAIRKNWPVADHYVVLEKPLLTPEQVAELGDKEKMQDTRIVLVNSTVGLSHKILAARYQEQSNLLGTTLLAFAVPAEAPLTKQQEMYNQDTRFVRQIQPVCHQFALLVPQALAARTVEY